MRKSSCIPTGNVYLKTALVEAANAAARPKGTYLRDKLFRLRARYGYKRAAVAVGAGPAGAGEHHPVTHNVDRSHGGIEPGATV